MNHAIMIIMSSALFVTGSVLDVFLKRDLSLLFYQCMCVCVRVCHLYDVDVRGGHQAPWSQSNRLLPGAAGIRAGNRTEVLCESSMLS